MDDTAALRATVRRCTAVLVAVIGITGWTVAGARDAGLPLLIAVGAVVYLGNDLLDVIPDYEGSADNSEDASAADEGR